MTAEQKVMTEERLRELLRTMLLEEWNPTRVQVEEVLFAFRDLTETVQRLRAEKKCVWKEYRWKEHGQQFMGMRTSCGHHEGVIHHKFCPFCGGEIEVKE